MNTQFAGLGLAEPLLRAVTAAGYTTPTAIQSKAIPLVLAGGDLLAAAQTGTGKTAGFVLPILHRLHTTEPAQDVRPGRPRCLVITPTRELAAQVEESVRTYGKFVPVKSLVIYGGVGMQPQVAQLRKRVDILVATPGRLLDHAGQRTVDLSGVEILVLDEGDRMLDMGFIHDIKRVLALMPKRRQSLLFSATFSDDVRALANQLLNNPGSVDVAPRNSACELVSQTVHLVSQSDKRSLLSHLIREHNWAQVLVFTRTKHGANRLAETLEKDGIPSAAIHGNKSQSARTRALSDFKAGRVPVLVATDIAARGLDIEELPYVVNFELPHVAEDYVHRIGRTGRAGSSGQAVSLVDAEEIQLLRAIEKLIKRPIERVTVEGFVPRAIRDPAEHNGRHRRPAQAPDHPLERESQRRHANNSTREARPGAKRGDSARVSRAHGDAASPGHRISHAPREAPHGKRAETASEQPSCDARSEAARHQAQPQPALFSPKPQQRRR